MNAKLRQAVETLAREDQVEWTTEKVPHGAEPGARELFISVGSRNEAQPPHPRMLAWKLPQWTRRSVRSSTEVVLHSAAELDSFAQELGQGQPPGTLGPLT